MGHHAPAISTGVWRRSACKEFVTAWFQICSTVSQSLTSPSSTGDDTCAHKTQHQNVKHKYKACHAISPRRSTRIDVTSTFSWYACRLKMHGWLSSEPSATAFPTLCTHNRRITTTCALNNPFYCSDCSANRARTEGK